MYDNRGAGGAGEEKTASTPVRGGGGELQRWYPHSLKALGWVVRGGGVLTALRMLNYGWNFSDNFSHYFNSPFFNLYSSLSLMR